MPIYISRQTYKILVLALLALIALVIWAVPSVLVVVFGGMALALLLSFPVGVLAEVVPRKIAVTIVALAILAGLLVAVYGLAPMIARQFGSLAAAMPEILQVLEGYVEQALAALQQIGILGEATAEVSSFISEDLETGLATVARSFLGGTFGFLFGTVSVVIIAFSVIFVALSLLANTRGIEASYLRATPRPYRPDARLLWNSMATTMSRYIGGLGLICLLQGLLSWLALVLIGVPYAMALGAWVAVTAVIPYLGAWIGAIPAVLVALSISPLTALLTGILFVVIQQVEGTFLTPAIQGRSIRVPPLVIFLGVFVGGALFGIGGVIFAVPAVAAIRVLIDFFGPRIKVRRARFPDQPA